MWSRHLIGGNGCGHGIWEGECGHRAFGREEGNGCGHRAFGRDEGVGVVTGQLVGGEMGVVTGQLMGRRVWSQNSW